jgi:hypothetical protein
MIVCLSVQEFVLKLTNEDFQDQIYKDLQDQVYGDFKTKYTRIPIFSFQSNKASVLKYITPILSIYSIELELHDRNV